jgi:hypothetical protein
MVVKLTAQLLREENERRGLNKSLTDKTMAEFFMEIRHNETLLAQQHRDRELAPVLDVIKGTRSHDSLLPASNVSHPTLALVGARIGHGAASNGSPFVSSARPGRPDAGKPLVRIGVATGTAFDDGDYDDGDDDDDGPIETIKTRRKP